MSPTELCLVYAAPIAIVVGLLKKIPFVAKNPKLIATVLSIVINVAGSKIGHTPIPFADLVKCVIESLGGSVLAHEALMDKNGLRGWVTGAWRYFA